MKIEITMRIRAAACLVLLGVTACGAGQSQPKVPDSKSAAPSSGPDVDHLEPAPDAAQASERSLAPMAETALQLSGEELSLLCGPEQSVTGAFTLAQAQKEVLDLDQTVEQHFKKLLKAPAGKCGAAATELYEQFESEKAVSRSFCDKLAPYGIGIKGSELDAQTEMLTIRAQQRNDEMKQSEATCTEKRAEQISEMARWRGARAILCAPTPAQRGIVECGILSTSEAKKARAQALCQKDASADAREKAQKDVAHCLGSVERSAAGSDRGLDRAPAPTLPTASLETRLLTGTTDFFEARAKEEAQLFAYEVVKNHLCDCESPVKPLLVNTCALFDADETLAPTPAAIREAARSDFKNAPVVLVEMIKKAEKENNKDQEPVLACGAALAWTFGSEAVEGADVLELLANPGPIVDAALVKDPQANPACSVKVRTLIVEIAKELKKRLEQDRLRLAGAVRAGDYSRALGGDPRNRGVNPSEYDAVLKKVLERVRQLDQAHQAWKKDPSRQNRAAVVTAGLRTIEPILAFAIAKYASTETAERAGKTITSSIKLTSQLINQEYAASVVTTAELATTAGLKDGKARNLLGLAAGLAQAESSDEVRATLEDAALPLGSWRRKNERRIGVTLTGLVGFQAGHEFVLGETSGKGSVAGGPVIAPTLLIGPDIHYGTGKGVRVGAQFSILDLGALLSFRTSKPEVDTPNETANQTPDIRVEQIFSPGIYPYFGFGPLTIGPALSFVPSLRQAGTAADKDALNVVRLGAFATIDVSVLPLY